MKLSLLPLILSVLTIISPESGEGYRILCVFPLPVRSHFIMFEALMKGLARKGHQVDVAGGFPLKKPHANYTDIIAWPSTPTSFTYEALRKEMNDQVRFIAIEMGNKACEKLNHPEIQKIIQNPPTDPPYDLVITQYLSTSCFMALGHRLKVPVVGVSSSALYPWSHRSVANPPNLAFAPNNLINYVAPMTFWQRLHNTVHAMYIDLYFHHLIRPQNEIMKRYLGEDAPSVNEAENSLAVLLVNSHPSINGPKPMSPAVIEVGGLHIERDDHDVLPQDLKEWMDNSTDGFIYFSFGTMLVIETFPLEMIEVIYKSLGKVAPIRVLIKIPNPERLPPGMPKNFRTFNWAPQFQALKHKNIKAFITHGGLFGTQEAIHCAVPMIGMPFMVDQFVNVDQYSKMKIVVPLKSLTEEAMDAALNEVLHNPVYKETVQKVSARFSDRPMSALDTAAWWVEYAVRHGNEALRSPALDLYWWQIQLLDVYAFILLTTTFVLSIMIALIRFIVKRLLITIHFKIGYRKKQE